MAYSKAETLLANKSSSSQGYGFSCGMYGCESWIVKKAECRRIAFLFFFIFRIDALTVVLEKTLESPLDCKEIQPVHSEGDQPWDLFGRNDAKA